MMKINKENIDYTKPIVIVLSIDVESGFALTAGGNIDDYDEETDLG